MNIIKVSLVIVLFILINTFPSVGDAGTPVFNKIHRGIHLSAFNLPIKRGDISLLKPEKGIAKLINALDLLYTKSPFSVKHLETLKRNGRVTIVYDANFPKHQFASVTIAAFFPDFFQKEAGGQKQFLVVVGRFGIKWPTNKLATVIAHELVGHGLQHFRGYRNKDRRIDLECEAIIYQIQSQQDLRIRSDLTDMRRFRRDVRGKWCADFDRYMTSSDINPDKAWGYGNPDVKMLLTYFEAYRKYLRNTGVSSKAVTAAKAKQANAFATFRAEAERTASAEKILIVGKRYLKGFGVEKNLKKGALWVAKSARLGHPPAQYLMGVLNTRGLGLRKDRIEAYAWLSVAIQNGFYKGQKLLNKIEQHMSPKDREEGRRRAKER